MLFGTHNLLLSLKTALSPWVIYGTLSMKKEVKVSSNIAVGKWN
jgi:hypothetical protein